MGEGKGEGEEGTNADGRQRCETKTIYNENKQVLRGYDDNDARAAVKSWWGREYEGRVQVGECMTI